MSEPSNTTPALVYLFACRACGTRYSYPRADCPNCHSVDIDTIAASGDGSLYSYTVVVRAPSEALRKDVPYTIAIVKTAEGPHLMGRLVNAASDSLSIGMAVRAITPSAEWAEQGIRHVFEPAPGGMA